jgi:copper chaperone
MKFNVPDMSCGHCVSSITKSIKALDSHAQVTADLSAKTLTVETSAAAAAVSRALDEAGYPHTAA